MSFSRRKPALLIFVNACILIVAFVWLTQSLLVINRLAQVQVVSGSTQVQRAESEQWAPFQSGDTLGVRDSVKTGKTGTVMLAFSDGTRWKLGPNSRFTLAAASVSAMEKQENSRLQLDAGVLWARVPKKLKSDSHFEIETPGATVSTRGAVFSVQIRDANTTQVWCALGEVETRAQGRTTRLKRGQIWPPVSGAVQWSGASSFLAPLLKTEIVQNGKIVVLRGQTEAGSQLFVNGKKVQVLGNGAFFQPLKMRDKRRDFRVQARDIFGGQSSLCQSVVFKNDTLKSGACGA